MRILLLDQFGEMGGAQFALLEAAAGFVARGWELYALVPEGSLAEKLKALCCAVEPLPCGPFQSVRKTVRDGFRFATQMVQQVARIRHAVAVFSIDVIYVNGPRVVPSAVWAQTGKPVVFHSHSVVQQTAAAWITGQALKRCDVSVVASSRFVCGWMQPFVPMEQIHVVYNGVAGFACVPTRRGSFTRIGVLGRIAPEKGQLVFVEAANLASQQNPDLRFVVCGGPMFAGREYFAEVQRVAGESVAFAAWTDNIAAFFQQIDMLVVPSERVDANPRVIIEAFAAGVPVMAFDSGGISELIDHGVSGLLVRQHGSKSLAQAMVHAVQDPERLNGIARNAYARWQRHYTLQRFQSEISDVIDAAAGVRTPRQIEPASIPA